MSTTATETMGSQRDRTMARGQRGPRGPRGWNQPGTMHYDWRKEYLTSALLVLPNIAVIVIFNYWAAIQNFYPSSTSWDAVTDSVTADKRREVGH